MQLLPQISGDFEFDMQYGPASSNLIVGRVGLWVREWFLARLKKVTIHKLET